MPDSPTTANQTNPPTKPRRRRWLQFSLRSLLIFTTLCAVAAALLARRMEQKGNERDAVEAIRRAGGTVRYGYQYDRSGKAVPNAMPTGWAWLRVLLGDNFFSEVDSVFLYAPVRCRALGRADPGTKDLKRLELVGEKPADDDLDYIVRLPRLTTFGVPGNKITDVGLAKICALRELNSLDISGSAISDAGLAALVNLPALEHLTLEHTSISDEGIAKLRILSKLSSLNLAGTRISDASLKYLQSIENLEWLNLSQTQITNAALPKVAALRKLRSLDLKDTVVDDKGIELLAKLSNLQFLDLRNKRITDIGLKRLEEMKQLRSLQLTAKNTSDRALERIGEVNQLPLVLRQNRISDKAVAELRQALPNCRISR